MQILRLPVNNPDELRIIIDKSGYTGEHMYNVDETGLFWKRMPSRTFICSNGTLHAFTYINIRDLHGLRQNPQA